MDFYILQPGGAKRVNGATYHTTPCITVVEEFTSNPYTARHRAFKHAIEEYTRKIVVISHPVQLMHRPHWNGKGAATEAHYMNDKGHHGLWEYMNRLLERYSHVYVPPFAWMRPWKKNAKPSDHVTHINNPTLPMVAGYRVDALKQLDPALFGHAGIGLELVEAGYDSFTVSDYFFVEHPAVRRMDETGSADVWQKAYERAIKEKL